MLITALTGQFQSAGQPAALAAESARRFVTTAREQGATVDPALLLKMFS
jgi:hypothetical protein